MNKKIKILGLLLMCFLAFSACNNSDEKCGDDCKTECCEAGEECGDDCEKACCADKESCGDDCEKACCSDKEACGDDCEKECRAHKKHKKCCKDKESCEHHKSDNDTDEEVESTEGAEESAAPVGDEQAHVCNDECHANGCTAKH
ncbi:MAG: hypothetical protein JXR19_03985 [Bacteroidia bacterium]